MSQPGQRFERVRRVGGGSTGVVWEAFDHVRGSRVALKVLREVDGKGIIRFKDEFRKLADVAHPNLITFYELVSSDEDWLLSMEFVDGTDLATYVAKDDANRSRTREALAQLVAALSAVHAAGMVHRDVKPSNVIVSRAGRLVLLDFGLVTALENSYDADDADSIVGTAGYIAPEQISEGTNTTFAADWYSVGVMLYEILAGEPPFRGSLVDILMAKEQSEPVPVAELAPDAPADLAALCTRLLSRDPAHRPGAAELLEAFGGGIDALTPTTHDDVPLVGRQRQLEQLRAAFERTRTGACITVYVRGPSGVGKTALIDAFTREQRANEAATVLRGRCFERESTPYMGFDALIDDLAHQLAARPLREASELLPPHTSELARLFPGLRRVEAVALRAPGEGAVDPYERRRRAAAALRELCKRLRKERGLILVLDDLQWADSDSAGLLDELTRQPNAPAMLVIAAVRTDDDDQALVDRGIWSRLARTGATDVERIQVGALDPSAARELAASLLPEAQRSAADTIAWEAGGSPLFVRELVQYVLAGRGLERSESGESLTLEDVLMTRIDHLPEAAGQLLDVVAIAGGPIAMRDAVRAARLSGDPSAALAQLRAARLIRGRASRPDDPIETFHDRVRSAVLGGMPPPRRTSLHRAIALALEASPKADPEALARHWYGGGQGSRALRYVRAAAKRAADALAFDRAAAMYERYLESDELSQSERHDAQVRLGDALANAGVGADAGEAFLAAVATAPSRSDATELERRAAEQLLRSGHIERGLAATRRALAPFGVKVAETPRRALASLLYQRARLRMRGMKFRPRNTRDVPAEELARVDTLWSSAIGLAMVDPIRATELQTRCTRVALKVGERRRVARALVGETMLVATAGAQARARANELSKTAEGLAQALGDAYSRAMVQVSRAYIGFLCGVWQETVNHAKPAIGLFRNHCPGSWWELTSVRHIMMWSQAYLGDIRELPRRVFPALREAEGRGDLYAATMLSTGFNNLAWLAVGDVDVARERLELADDRWTDDGFHLQDYNALLARAQLALYTGAARDAHVTVLDGWRALEGSLLLRTEQIRIEAENLRARVALARSGEDRKLLAEARRLQSRGSRERAPWSRPLAALVEAGIRARENQTERVVALLSPLPAAFEEVSMAAHADVSRIRRGELIGGDEGEALVRDGRASLEDRGISDPISWCAMIAPGFD